MAWLEQKGKAVKSKKKDLAWKLPTCTVLVLQIIISTLTASKCSSDLTWLQIPLIKSTTGAIKLTIRDTLKDDHGDDDHGDNDDNKNKAQGKKRRVDKDGPEKEVKASRKKSKLVKSAEQIVDSDEEAKQMLTKSESSYLWYLGTEC